MTLDQLRYFVAAAKYENVGKGAKSIPISASVVSSAIRSLEEEFDCTFFSREKKKMKISAEGAHFLEMAEKLLAQADRFGEALKGDSSQLKGHYRVGASTYLARKVVAPVWTKMIEKHKNLSVDVCSSPTWNLVEDTLNGKIDFGIGFSPAPHPDLDSQVLYRGISNILVSKKHPILNEPVDKAYTKLHQYPCTMHIASSKVISGRGHPVLKAANAFGRINFGFDDDYVALENLRHSNNWTFMLDIFSNEFKKDLVQLPLPGKSDAPYTIEVFRHKSVEDSSVLRTFIDGTKDRIKKITK